MLRDIWGQAWEAMLYNRRRTAITMIGMAWGIATVVLLLAYGAGFTRAIEAIFAQWGTNIIGVFPGRTSEQAGGEKSGVQVRFTEDDVDRISNAVQGIIHISEQVQKDVPVQNDLHTYTWTVNGVQPVFQDIWKLDVDQAGSSMAPRISSAPTSASSALKPRPSSTPASGPWARAFVSTGSCSPSSVCSHPKCRKAASRTIATARSTFPSAP